MEYGVCCECQGTFPVEEEQSAGNMSSRLLMGSHWNSGIPCKGEGTVPQAVLSEEGHSAYSRHARRQFLRDAKPELKDLCELVRLCAAGWIELCPSENSWHFVHPTLPNMVIDWDPREGESED